jgi:hypothetical protein
VYNFFCARRIYVVDPHWQFIEIIGDHLLSENVTVFHQEKGEGGAAM